MTSDEGGTSLKARATLPYYAFVTIVALLFFTSSLIGLVWYQSKEPIKAVVSVERLHLDKSADRMSDLVSVVDLSLDVERGTIHKLVRDALKQGGADRNGNGENSLKSLALGETGIATEEIALSVEKILEKLRVDPAPGMSGLEISLPNHSFSADRGHVDLVDGIAALYVDFRNQERSQQRDQADIWADHLKADRLEVVTQLNTIRDYMRNGIAADTSGRPTAGVKLLGFSTKVARSAQAGLLVEIHQVINPDDQEEGQRDVGLLSQEYTILTNEVKRLENFSPLASQSLDQVTRELGRAEEALGGFKDDVKSFKTSGLLSKPAASLVAGAYATPPISPTQWTIVFALAAILSTALAIVLATVIFRHRRSEDSKDVTDTSMLTDPFWPMGRHHNIPSDISTSQLDQPVTQTSRSSK